MTQLCQNIYGSSKKKEFQSDVEDHHNRKSQLKPKKKVKLCLTEKAAILKENPAAILNTRSDILSKCRHRNKFKLKKILK